MIAFEKFILDNGLRIIVHRDTSTPMVAVNLLYDVGARDENPAKTGFAHLFEHLMFEGSVNIPEFDRPLQMAGGSNNAFTSNDITNYYESIPAQNLEIPLWLESDRMLSLDFSEEKLALQKKVVIEEFKQRYLNQPYGDIWLLSRDLSYRTHPYRWPTIGKEISHIESATLQDVKDFFFSHYAPNNCILVVAGNVEVQEALENVRKWFGDIPRRNVPVRNLPQEPVQEYQRRMQVERPVPSDALMLNFHMAQRNSREFLALDLLSDILSSGRSSRLYHRLVKEKPIFTEIGSYVTGSIDPGQFIIFGKLDKKYTIADGEEAVWELLDEVRSVPVSEEELEKVKNKIETNERFGLQNVLNTAMKLAYAELLGDADMVNTELEQYRSITAADILSFAQQKLTVNNSSIIEYKANA